MLATDTPDGAFSSITVEAMYWIACFPAMNNGVFGITLTLSRLPTWQCALLPQCLSKFTCTSSISSHVTVFSCTILAWSEAFSNHVPLDHPPMLSNCGPFLPDFISQGLFPGSCMLETYGGISPPHFTCEQKCWVLYPKKRMAEAVSELPLIHTACPSPLKKTEQKPSCHLPGTGLILGCNAAPSTALRIDAAFRASFCQLNQATFWKVIWISCVTDAFLEFLRWEVWPGGNKQSWGNRGEPARGACPF